MLVQRTEKHSSFDDPAVPVLVSRYQKELQPITGVLDLRRLWQILRWRARLIAAITLATVLAAAGALTILPPKYKATTVVLVEPRQPHVTNTEAVLSGIGPDAAAVESQVELIESSSLARKVIDRLGLTQDREFTSPSLLERITDGLRALIGLNSENTSPDAQISRLVSRFQNGLTVRRRGLTYVLEISYASKEPAKAAEISGAIAEAYLDDQRLAKGDMTARASGWLGDRIDEMRERVRSAEEAVAAYKAANSIVDVTQGNKLINRQVEDLTQQLALGRTRTADARARLERVQAMQQTADPATLNEALQSPVIANLRSQYAEAARIQADYGATYGDRHPTLIAARAQLADLRRQIDNEIARILIGVRNDYQVATGREASLEAQLTRLMEQSATMSQADVRLRELEREAHATRTLFEQYLNRVKETSEQQSLQIADARIVSPALRPIKPDRPATPLLLGAAGSFGFILAIGLVLMWEQMRQGFRNLSEIQQYLSLPGIGVLPQQTPPPESSATTSQASRAARYAFDNPDSPYAQSLQAVSARLRRSGTKSRNEILVVISAVRGEGKSTFACNFALSSAAAGVRTLLVDGDVYAASVREAFGIKRAGFFELVQGKAAFSNVIFKDAKSGLHVVGACDAALATGVKDVDKFRLAAHLREIRKHFDLVIIDSPAVLPFGGTQYLESADRALLIVEWEKTDRQAVAEALDALGPHIQKVAGVILNKVSMDWYKFPDNHRYLQYDSYGKLAA